MRLKGAGILTARETAAVRGAQYRGIVDAVSSSSPKTRSKRGESSRVNDDPPQLICGYRVYDLRGGRGCVRPRSASKPRNLAKRGLS